MTITNAPLGASPDVRPGQSHTVTPCTGDDSLLLARIEEICHSLNNTEQKMRGLVRPGSVLDDVRREIEATRNLLVSIVTDRLLA